MLSANDKQHILDLTLDEFTQACIEHGLETYRAAQVFEWIYHKRCAEFPKMTNLSKLLRDRLDDRYAILTAKQLVARESQDGTRKLLLQCGDRKHVETVLIPAGERLSACLSTQAGCPVKCAFCATGQGAFAGNLTAGEIIEQLLRLQILADQTAQRIGHVVFMGMGEPLLNYENTLKALRIINSPWSFHIAARHITLSTVGLPDPIRRLAEQRLQINLAISLHAADQATREQLIPFAKNAPLDEIVDAARYYFQLTGREVTLEYVMLDGVNVSDRDARRLGKLAKEIRANVNLIAFNPVEDSPFQAPSRSASRAFLQLLRKLNVNVHLRTSKGKDIEAACGQLRKRIREGPSES